MGPGVPSVIHLKTLHLGPEELLVAAKIEVDVREGASEIADAIETSAPRRRVPNSSLMVAVPAPAIMLVGTAKTTWTRTSVPNEGTANAWITSAPVI